MKPETPLPWDESSMCDWYNVKMADVRFIIHACNAYPQLVEFLRDRRKKDEYGLAEKLLKEIGEDS